MAPRPQKKLFSRRKVCRFCADKELAINYKDVKTLRNFVSERGKIIPRRILGTCATHQRQLCEAVNQARQLAFLRYSGSTQG
jgi:small subunit ribosomal protein S18